MFLGVIALGLALGLNVPTGRALPDPFQTISSVVGWTYFSAWSVSFYPQVILNWRRKSVVGLSFDFLALNLIGWICYSSFNVALYFFPVQVGVVSDGTRRLVELNDVFFSLHALVLTLITVYQCCIYERGKQRLSGPSRLLLIIVGVFVLSYGCSIATLACQHCHEYLNWLSFVYFLSFVKMGISLIKYFPQMWYNFQRRSTAGWNILNVLLDFFGGFLSLGQVLLTCTVLDDWSAIVGNPVKFGLGSVSMVFDTVFMLQHYVLYAEKPEPVPEVAPDVTVDRQQPPRITLCSILKQFVVHPERLPSGLCEELCRKCVEHGIDVDICALLSHFADHPRQLPPECAYQLVESANMLSAASVPVGVPELAEPLLPRSNSV